MKEKWCLKCLYTRWTLAYGIGYHQGMALRWNRWVVGLAFGVVPLCSTSSCNHRAFSGATDAGVDGDAGLATDSAARPSEDAGCLVLDGGPSDFLVDGPPTQANDGAQADSPVAEDLDAPQPGQDAAASAFDQSATEAGFVDGEAGVVVATILNSGNANRPQVTTVVYADGSATQTDMFYGSDGGTRFLPPGSPAVVQFLLDLTVAGDIAAIKTVDCVKSTSFGYSIILTVGGVHSGDLDCARYNSPMPAQLALADDCEVLTMP